VPYALGPSDPGGDTSDISLRQKGQIGGKSGDENEKGKTFAGNRTSRNPGRHSSKKETSVTGTLIRLGKSEDPGKKRGFIQGGACAGDLNPGLEGESDSPGRALGEPVRCTTYSFRLAFRLFGF